MFTSKQFIIIAFILILLYIGAIEYFNYKHTYLDSLMTANIDEAALNAKTKAIWDKNNAVMEQAGLKSYEQKMKYITKKVKGAQTEAAIGTGVGIAAGIAVLVPGVGPIASVIILGSAAAVKGAATIDAKNKLAKVSQIK